MLSNTQTLSPSHTHDHTDNTHLQFALEFLVVAIDGILAVISTLQQAVSHLDLQQVVQHLRLVLDSVRCVQQLDLAHAKVVWDQGVEPVGGVHKLSLGAALVDKLGKLKDNDK